MSSIQVRERSLMPEPNKTLPTRLCYNGKCQNPWCRLSLNVVQTKVAAAKIIRLEIEQVF